MGKKGSTTRATKMEDRRRMKERRRRRKERRRRRRRRRKEERRKKKEEVRETYTNVIDQHLVKTDRAQGALNNVCNGQRSSH